LTKNSDPKEGKYIWDIIVAVNKLYIAWVEVEQVSDEDLETPSFIRKMLNKLQWE
jgi:hypothetical protein